MAFRNGVPVLEVKPMRMLEVSGDLSRKPRQRGTLRVMPATKLILVGSKSSVALLTR